MYCAGPLTQMPLTALGNISPKRFVALDTTVFQGANQASAATDLIVGVSAAKTRYTPNSPADDGFNAIVNEPLSYHGPGTICLLTLGATVSNPKVLLTSDADGKGTPLAPADGTTRYYGAIALRAGVSGDDIPVFVIGPTPTV